MMAAFLSLAQLAGDWKGALPDGGAMIEQKHDGIRAMRFTGISGATRLWSRNGHVIEGTAHILHRLALLEKVAGEQLMFDGEFIVDGTLAATKAWFERGWKTGAEAGVYHLFDCLPLADWQRGGCDIPLYQRKAYLAALWQAVEDQGLSWDWRPGSRGRDDGASPVLLVADQWVSDARDAMDFTRRVWATGGEGAMIKDAMSPYRRKRSDAWQKLKPGGPWARAA